MLKRLMKIVAAIGLSLALVGGAEGQLTYDKWTIGEIYTNANGSIQFIMFYYIFDVGGSLAGQTLIASNGVLAHTFTFPHDVPVGDQAFLCEDVCETFLVASQGFADLDLVKPDFVVPNGFLFIPGGSITFLSGKVEYVALPTDGENALWENIADGGDYVSTALAIPNNYPYVAGPSYLFMPVGVNDVVEFYNAATDDYFLTAYTEEIRQLDGSQGWQRTGFSIRAWTSPFFVDMSTLPKLIPVCRLFLGDSHFYSASATECGDVISQHPDWWFVHESDAAFFATLPNTQTGECPADQTAVYRLWNPRGSGHRYTTSTGVRHDMLSRGYVAEGYGQDGVTMCVGGGT